MLDPKQGQAPLVHFQQYPTVKVPVKLNPVNFDGVFNNMKFQMEQTNLMPNIQQIKGQFQQNGQDMQNLIQVQNMNIQNLQQIAMQNIGGNGGLGINMGGMLIENRYNPNQMQPQTDYNYSSDMKGQKLQRRPSTNKLQNDQNSNQNQRMISGPMNNSSSISVSAASIA